MRIRLKGGKTKDFHDDESFESLVDLFTLISISLILATVIYGLKNNINMEATTVPIKEIIDQTGSTDISLENVIILYVSHDEGQDKIVFNDSDRGRRISPVSRKTVDSILDSELMLLSNASKILLGVDSGGTDTTQALFTDVQRWFFSHEMDDRLSIGFSRK